MHLPEAERVGQGQAGEPLEALSRVESTRKAVEVHLGPLACVELYDFEREVRAEEAAAVRATLEASERTAENAHWWVDVYCNKHDGYHLQVGADGTDYVFRALDSANQACIALNDERWRYAGLANPRLERYKALCAELNELWSDAWQAWENDMREVRAPITPEHAFAHGWMDALKAIEEAAPSEAAYIVLPAHPLVPAFWSGQRWQSFFVDGKWEAAPSEANR